jgi:hypothetical protein
MEQQLRQIRGTGYSVCVQLDDRKRIPKLIHDNFSVQTIKDLAKDANIRKYYGYSKKELITKLQSLGILE